MSTPITVTCPHCGEDFQPPDEAPDECWRCAEYGDKIPSHCKNCGVCEECECAVECESRETLGAKGKELPLVLGGISAERAKKIREGLKTRSIK